MIDCCPEADIADLSQDPFVSLDILWFISDLPVNLLCIEKAKHSKTRARYLHAREQHEEEDWNCKDYEKVPEKLRNRFTSQGTPSTFSERFKTLFCLFV